MQLVLNVLRAIADPDDGGAVYHALGDPMFGVDTQDLGWISARARARRASLVAFAAATARDRTSEITEASRAGILRFADLHRRLSASAVHRATTEVMYEFAEDSGLLAALADAGSPEAVEQAQNLNKLLHIAARIGPLLVRDRVADFIGHLDLLIDAGDDPSAAEVERDDDAVHLLTAHNAKGLEFPVVYVTQLVQQRFPGNYRADTLALPPELQRDATDEKKAHEREERRLFFVAMTRAMDRLVFTYATDYGGGYRPSARKLSKFVIEALGLAGAPAEPARASGAQGIARFAPGAEPAPRDVPPVPDDVPLHISHQQVDDFLTCPLKYRYAHVMKIPLQRDPRAMFGIAMHHAIKIYHRHRIKGLPIDADAVVAAFGEAWSSEGFYSREHEERRLEEGRATLRAFVAAEDRRRELPLAIEMEFSFKVGIDVVAGRFDRIDERDDGIVLVDYKTSEVEERERADRRAKESLESRPARHVRARLRRDAGWRHPGARRAALHRVGARRRGDRQPRAPRGGARAHRRRRRRHPRRPLPGPARPEEVPVLPVHAVLQPQRDAGLRMSESPAALRDAAIAFAREAGAILLEGYGTLHAYDRKGGIDLVTDYDRRSEALLLRRIGERFPAHGVLAEESGLHEIRSGTTRWIVDPLDGTTNFAHNYPFSAFRSASSATARWSPARSTTRCATRCSRAAAGQGATRNGAPIRVSAVARLDDALLVTGFPYTVREHPESIVPLFQAFLVRAQGVRRDGSAALNLGYLACGRFDGFWERHLSAWDMAAGTLIVREAGGRITRYDGSAFALDRREILATNGRFHDEMMAVIAASDPLRGATFPS